MFKRVLAFCIAFIIAIPLGLAIIPETVVDAALNTKGQATVNDGVFQCVPTPGEVVIDGDFSEGEWDWSGRLISYDNIDYSDVYRVEVASMWDSENLYMGFKFTDTSPMVNIKDPVLEPTWTWVGDSIQLRTLTDRTRGWMTVSYYQVTDVGSLFYEFIDENDHVGYITEPGSSKLNKINYQAGEPKAICLDAEVKYKRWEDNRGYNVELKIPFRMMFSTAQPKTAGTRFNLGIECYWCDMTGDSYREHWEFLQGGGAGNIKNWKEIELLSSGNVTPRQYIHDDKDRPLGTIHIPVKVPKQAKKITLVVEDNKGTRISNAVNEWTVDEKSIIGEEDGCYIVDTLWDGTGLDGYMVAPGEYTVRGIWHEGIVPYFDEAAYNPGNPPWPDSTGNGSWASDHHPPVSITSIGDKVYIGSENCESGTGIFMIDNDGTKLWGIKRGAHMLASNDDYVFALPGNDFYADTTKGNTYVMRLDADTGKFAPFFLNGEQRDLQLYISDILDLDSSKYMPRIEGFAANNEYFVLATANDDPYKTYSGAGYMKYGDIINVVDAQSGVLKKRIALDGVGKVAFGENGLLYAIAKNKVAEVNIKTGKITYLPITAQEGEEFKNLTIDNDGNIVIYERTDRQLKVYNKAGKKLYEIGKKGGRAIVGWWEEDGLTHQVSAITVDSNDQIWVAEEWNYPRRISTWNKDGFVQDFIGGPGYMAAGGSLHNEDPEKVYCGPNEMILDRENHTYKMSRVLYVPNWDKGQDFLLNVNGNTRVTHFRSDASGEMHNYIYLAHERDGAVLYKENDDGSFQPFWATGRTDNLFSGTGYGKYVPALDADIYRSSPSITSRKLKAQFDNMTNRQYIWNDWDGDGAIEADECEFWLYNNGRSLTLNGSWGGTITNDFEFTVTEDYTSETQRTPRSLYKVSPDYYREGGLPVYSWKSFKQIDVETFPFDGDNILTEGGTIISVRDLDGQSGTSYYNGIKCIDPETGEDLWWYANPYAGVHGAQKGPKISDDGAVVGTIKVMGTVPVDRGGEVFCIRGYLGEDYLFTTDGYFVQTLFRDGRIPMLKLPDNYEDAVGMDMSLYSENGEPWSGIFVKHTDGEVRLLSSTAGPSIIICRVEGLDTITDIAPFKIKVTKAMLDEAYAYNTSDPVEATTEEETAVSNGYAIAKIDKEMTIDGETGDWVGVGTDLTIAKDGIEENGTATLAYDDENLYALYVINDNSPMVNNGNEYQKLFKTGDLCDLMLSNTASTSGSTKLGDKRISMGVFDGKPVAVLSEPVSDKEQTYRYSSPVTTLDFDYVGLIEDAEVAITRDTDTGMYILEAKLPLASIGIDGKVGKNVTGDVGIVISDEIGATNRARIYWSNKETELVYDVPGEATLYPNKWSKMYFAEK